MATHTFRLVAAVAAALALAHSASHAPASAAPALDGDEIELIGNAGRAKDTLKPKVTAFFTQESYGPGASARLVIQDTASHVTVQIERAGEERRVSFAHDVMRGTPVGEPIRLGAVVGRRTVQLRIGAWPSGVYFARLTAPGSRVGFAPFVLRPAHLSEHRIAVVMPTQTW